VAYARQRSGKVWRFWASSVVRVTNEEVRMTSLSKSSIAPLHSVDRISWASWPGRLVGALAVLAVGAVHLQQYASARAAAGAPEVLTDFCYLRRDG
jgi:hypothetical protein